MTINNRDTTHGSEQPSQSLGSGVSIKNYKERGRGAD